MTQFKYYISIYIFHIQFGFSARLHPLICHLSLTRTYHTHHCYLLLSKMAQQQEQEEGKVSDYLRDQHSLHMRMN
jgi:hypothetical protein